MNRSRRVIPLLALVIASLAATPLVGQDPTTVQSDSAQTDSVPPPAVLPVPPHAAPPGPFPDGSRYSFTTDSLLWVSGVTLADLLVAIPGVYVARGGWFGQPEYIAYAGRGGAAIEVFWDGLPWHPVGGDSVFTELGQIPLSGLGRVDVEVLPAALRIHLISIRHKERDPRTELRVMSGAFDLGIFSGVFQKRWVSGIGVGVAADVLNTDGASGPNRDDASFQLWGRFDWMMTDRTGVSYQLRRRRHERDSVGVRPDVPERNGVRTDHWLLAFTGTEKDGLGLQARTGLGLTSWTEDSASSVGVIDQDIREIFGTLTYREPSWTAQVTARAATERFKTAVEGRWGWAPLRGVVLAGDARWIRHRGERTSTAVHGSIGLSRGPFALLGAIELKDAVQAPAIDADQSQRTLDASVRASLRTFPISGSVALVRRDAFRALPYPDFPLIPAADSAPEATYLVAQLKLRSSRALSVDAWYSNPVRGFATNLTPPKHGRAEITFRSKFWRTFRSGAFDFKIRVGMESWSTGIAGLDSNGERINLNGATFYDGYVQVRIVRFTGFWHLRNGYNSPDPYVPDLSYPTSVQNFGVKWEFRN